MVLMSMSTDPGAMPSITPSFPKTAASTWGEDTSMVITMSEQLAVSFDDLAAFAPTAANSHTGSGRISNTVTGYPFLTRLTAMGFPIAPSPINPIARPIVCSLWSTGNLASCSVES